MTPHDCCASNAEKPNGPYDLAVIGAGSAGFSAAITAADQGAHVALIGHGTIGGTCVNIGCVTFPRFGGHRVMRISPLLDRG